MAIEDLFSDVMSKENKRGRIKAIVTGTVKEVNDNTCTVERNEAPTLYNVRLQAIEDEVSSYIRITPKTGSSVVCGIIENMEAEAVVLQCSEIAEAWIKVGLQEYRIQSDGQMIACGNETLKEVIQLIIEAIQPVVVLIGTPPVYSKLVQALVKLLKILK